MYSPILGLGRGAVPAAGPAGALPSGVSLTPSRATDARLDTRVSPLQRACALPMAAPGSRLQESRGPCMPRWAPKDRAALPGTVDPTQPANQHSTAGGTHVPRPEPGATILYRPLFRTEISPTSTSARRHALFPGFSRAPERLFKFDIVLGGRAHSTCEPVERPGAYKVPISFLAPTARRRRTRRFFWYRSSSDFWAMARHAVTRSL